MYYIFKGIISNQFLLRIYNRTCPLSLLVQQYSLCISLIAVSISPLLKHSLQSEI